MHNHSFMIALKSKGHEDRVWNIAKTNLFTGLLGLIYIFLFHGRPPYLNFFALFPRTFESSQIDEVLDKN